jgi:hypothetical protein
LVKNDEDLSLLQQGINKYETQSSALSALKFNFETPLMRLMYNQNKTDQALATFNSDVNESRLL